MEQDKKYIRLAADLQSDSIVDGPGLRTVLWTQGCSHHCKGCQNPQTWDFEGGGLIPIDLVKQAIDELEDQDGFTFSGGDPMFQPEQCNEIAKYVRKKGMNIWVYTGFTYEELIKMSKVKPIYKEFLSNIDVLVANSFIIICDEIEDPHNLGAIIRTAETSGADGIIIPKRRSASLNATVFKTSAGAASYVPVARVSNLASCIDMLKENGVWIYGTDASGSDYDKTDFTGSCALVIGSEGFGISRLIQKKCDFMIKLPMLGKINSLNASVAAGIFMYEVLRQRRTL